MFRFFLRQKRTALNKLPQIWRPAWCAPCGHLPWWHIQIEAINSWIMRGNPLPFPVCRLVMYIERDSRKTTPGKEPHSGSEYLSRCLDLLICHVVQELPRILGKSEARPHTPCHVAFCDLTFLGITSFFFLLVCYCRQVQWHFSLNV